MPRVLLLVSLGLALILPDADANAASLSITPSEIELGESASIQWSSAAVSCQGSSFDFGGAVHTDFATGGAPAGTLMVTPTEDRVYRLSCATEQGTVEKAEATLMVSGDEPPPAPPVTASFSATPMTIALGETVLLEWTSSGAIECRGTGFDTGGALSGSRTVAPQMEVTTYRVSCFAETGVVAAKQVEITVEGGTPLPPPPPDVSVMLTADPELIGAGGSSLLEWSSINADTCRGVAFDMGGAVFPGEFDIGGALEGTMLVSPEITLLYRVVCNSDEGTEGMATVMVEVEGFDPTPPPAPDVSATLTANPEAIELGESTTLRWSSVNAQQCLGTGFNTGRNTYGTRKVYPLQTKTFSVTCHSEEGVAAKAAVTVTVGATPPPPPPPPPASGCTDSACLEQALRDARGVIDQALGQ